MTKDDFNRWLEYHCAAYPGLRKSLTEAGLATVEHWWRAIESVAYDDAKRATDRLLRGDDLLFKPGSNDVSFAWSDTPANIRRIANRLAGERIAEAGRERRQLDFLHGAAEPKQRWTLGGAFRTICHYLEEAVELGLTGKDVIDYATEKTWPDVLAGKEVGLPERISGPLAALDPVGRPLATVVPEAVKSPPTASEPWVHPGDSIPF